MARSPRDDKDRDLRRRSVGSVRHGVRRQQHREKAAVHRGYRRAQSQELARAGRLADDRVADTAEARIAAVRRGAEPRWGAEPTLAELVTGRLVERFLDMVDTFSAGPYRPAAQRARTERALAGIVRDRPAGRYVARVALDLDVLLPRRVLPGRTRWGARNTERRRAWFAAFLADAPAWEPRLARWVADHAT